jgi:hypothetical protein
MHNVYITGLSGNPGGCLTIRYNWDGNVIWVAIDSVDCEIANALTLLESNNITNTYITGRSSLDQIRYDTRHDIITENYNYFGQLVWKDRHSLSICDPRQTKDEEGYDITLTSLGLIAVTGYGYCPCPDDQFFDIVTLWYTPSGTLLREERFSQFCRGTEAGLAIYAGISAEYVTGRSFGCDTCDDTEFYIPILKYGHPGESSWVKVYGPAQDYAAGYDVVADAQGNVYIAGIFESDCIVLKYSSEGVLLWAYLYDSGGFDVGRAITLDSQNNILVAGEASGSTLILKLTAQGTLVWANRYDAYTYGGAVAIDIDALDNIYVTGDTTMKVSPDGNVLWIAPCFSGGNAIAVSPRYSIYPAVYTTGEYTVKIAQAPGDVNGDGCVDDTDLLLILIHFGESVFCSPYDLNGDVVVDDADLLIVLINFGQCWY